MLHLSTIHKTVRHHAHKIKHHPAFNPCQAVTQLGLIIIHFERATLAECCLMGSAFVLIVISVFDRGEIAELDV